MPEDDENAIKYTTMNTLSTELKLVVFKIIIMGHMGAGFIFYLSHHKFILYSTLIQLCAIFSFTMSSQLYHRLFM